MYLLKTAYLHWNISSTYIPKNFRAKPFFLYLNPWYQNLQQTFSENMQWRGWANLSSWVWEFMFNKTSWVQGWKQVGWNKVWKNSCRYLWGWLCHQRGGSGIIYITSITNILNILKLLVFLIFMMFESTKHSIDPV